MAEKPRPLSKEQAPDPSNVYERSHPENEAGMGRLNNNSKATPANRADKMPTTVKHAQDGSKQLNAHDDLQLPQSPAKKPANKAVSKSEPLGWDSGNKSGKKPKK